MSPLKIVFRADASLRIGTGHIMRCLTLANTLRQVGCDCLFVTRELQGHLADRIESLGFAVERLPSPDPGYEPSEGPMHAAWAEVPWQQDAAESDAAIAPHKPDWIVLDHYAFDERWEREVGEVDRCGLLVIDDLADRKHCADVLLDQTAGRSEDDYKDLVPASCRVLTGTRYSLLREEFAKARPKSLLNRNRPDICNILVTMGGVDLDDTTSQVLTILSDIGVPDESSVTVILGQNAPNLETVRTTAANVRFDCKVLCDVSNMADLMSQADIAIGAGGTSTWERCCLGLPSIIVVLAQNQSAVASTMSRSGAALVADSLQARVLSDALGRLTPVTFRAEMSETAAAICDGDGSWRVVSQLLGGDLELRPAAAGDARRVFDWRNAIEQESFFLSKDRPTYDQHYRWFDTALKDPQRRILICMVGGYASGYLRLDKTPDNEAQISICLDKFAQGRGIGTKVLQNAEKHAIDMQVERLVAKINVNNHSSIRAFEKAGFRHHAHDGPFAIYQLTIQGI
ncbi:UDP-2,4-diacetamido-2,4,6-trideoxy-beta-L-altropyranose hydrolase [Roseibium album]|uniref:UDP-2,4-diacetamido-2,4, 6-trideoxy-beta-L-altropyranose hydrolase n=1 Tax=Roseibium album TaxID=311410 RepID=UPI00248FC618|nr:UDP-2,4-diacetamido-2,4,6-trideoxy-beta-L-altropyranose hydrolase [Roseibium album]